MATWPTRAAEVIGDLQHLLAAHKRRYRKSSGDSQDFRIVIALHSRERICKSDYRWGLQRKSARKGLACVGVRSLRSGLPMEYREIPAFFVPLASKTAEFLYGSDCVAERAVTVMAASLQACGVFFPFAMPTSI